MNLLNKVSLPKMTSKLFNYSMRGFNDKKKYNIIFQTSSNKNFNSQTEACTTKDKIKKGISNYETKEKEEDFHKAYTRLIDGNKAYVDEMMQKDPNYFKDLAKGQEPKYLLIGCSDSRVPPNEMTKTNPGEIFIHRNIANQVNFSDLNCMSVIQFAVEYLKVEHIIVMGHTKCGGIVASTQKSHKGLLEQWLQSIRDVALQNKKELEECKSEEEMISKLTKMNIKSQALNVCKTTFVQKAWAKGQTLYIHAWLMDIETGLIEDLAISNEEWENIKHIYDFNYL